MTKVHIDPRYILPAPAGMVEFKKTGGFIINTTDMTWERWYYFEYRGRKYYVRNMGPNTLDIAVEKRWWEFWK
jgi:hypothetical protein